ncbi:hypothetical protein KJK32_46830 (plasmid) [Streptomyces sp. JCM17656]|nr:hypothetical protein KJK32_46830 [Streptomyces sp. JCM17656]
MQKPTYTEAVVDGALAIVTCLVNGDRSEARALAHGEYELHQPGIIEFLAEHVAQGYTPRHGARPSWRSAKRS